MPENVKAPPGGEALAVGESQSNEQRRQDQRDRRQQLDQDMQARAGGVFERIAQGIAHNCGLVRIGTFAAAFVLPALDELLGVVPSATAVIEERCHQDASDRADHQECRHRFRTDAEHTENETDGDRHGDCEKAGNDHLVSLYLGECRDFL